MTFSAFTGPIRWVARLSARLLTALALMSLLLAPAAARAAEPAPQPRAEQSAVTASVQEERAPSVRPAAAVHFGCLGDAEAVRPLLPAAAELFGSVTPGTHGCRAPPAR
ncbi:hypothetical protein CS0771_76260 [Catellatospora sp. IY07-71]|uniref:hypothetical protein n=1 Tax=Catellatospora sp. IY07-71 TaxID=2728827 RepID=UPI001BB431DA|nr:hypothetical protein [Catellatospora sp. IY07-71]BCJ78082.1 hypothetical protein CS0771_76260 [Catellatospora sp. IY07-71]